jgi:hypothetical protein
MSKVMNNLEKSMTVRWQEVHHRKIIHLNKIKHFQTITERKMGSPTDVYTLALFGEIDACYVTVRTRSPLKSPA